MFDAYLKCRQDDQGEASVVRPPGHQLRDAATSGDLAELEKLVRSGVSVNDCDSFNNTALLHAAKHGELDCVRFLIDNGADVNLANDNNYTPLICDVIIGDYETAKMLLDTKAEVWPAVKDEDDFPTMPPRTALFIAEYRRHYEIAELLKGAEALQIA